MTASLFRICARAALLLAASPAAIVPAASVDTVNAAIKRAATNYHSHAASHGGYVYQYSGDFTLREAEGIPGPDTIWIQPPGTPAVGAAFLRAHAATGDKASLQAATDAGHALSRTQLVSGGWDYSGHFDAGHRSTWLYRRSIVGKLLERRVAAPEESGWHVWRMRRHKDTNYSTLDDDVTQSALRFLIRVDQALAFKDEEIHEAAQYALTALLAAQYPNGAWSASFDSYPATPPDAIRYPLKKASFPASWSPIWPKDFTGCYVTNDDMHATMIYMLLLAWDVYHEARYLDAAKRAGDFLLLAQMPEPQPAWAQQYDANMQPVWSRAFEPPAVSGRESQAILWSLLSLASVTGEKKYLAAVPPAVAYLRKSLLPGGKLARFYELQTNRPIYFKRGPGGKGHELTYRGDNPASNYTWLWDPQLDEIESVWRQLNNGTPVLGLINGRPPKPITDEEVARVLASLDAEGAWIEREGARGQIRDASGAKTTPSAGVIHSDTFCNNITLLTAWLQSKKS